MLYFLRMPPKILRRALFVAALLAGSLLCPQALAIENASLLVERATRSFDEMVENRVIRALVVRNKTGYFFDGGQQRGINYDLMQGFEKQINEELQTGHLKIHVAYIPVSRDQLVPALLEGRGDIAVANLTITSERQDVVDFSLPFYKNVRELVITGPDVPLMSSISELSGRNIHVRESSSYYASLLQANARLLDRGEAPFNIVLANERLEDEDLLEMVNAGLIPAMVVDSHKAHFWQQIFDNIRIHEELALRNGGQIAWAFRKNSPMLEMHINKFVKNNRKGSLMGNMLFKRYLQNTSHVRNALEPDELERFNATLALFQKYADQYDFDWLMLIAQAYQESRLKQDTRSNAGAVGVMQVLPSTAADKSVAIENITELENNVHAGAKYMRWLRDNYFNEPGMSDEEQTLFSFAAYNAGPGRVRQLRREATKMGLDPNLWFDNVEVVAAKRIGRETVQYVSNIYKYWIAYKLAFDLSNDAKTAAGK